MKIEFDDRLFANALVAGKSLILPIPRFLSFETFLVHRLTPLFRKHGGLLWLVRTTTDLPKALRGWMFWQHLQRTTYEPPQVLMPERKAWDAESLAQLTGLMNDPCPFVIATPPPLPLPSRQQFLNASLRISLPSEKTRESIIERLVFMGFERAITSPYRGGFVVAGEIVIVWPHGLSHPLRLTFREDHLESLDDWDEQTGKAGARLSSAFIPPLRLPNEEHQSTLQEFISSHLWVIQEDERLLGNRVLLFPPVKGEPVLPLHRPTTYLHLPSVLSKELGWATKAGTLLVATSQSREARAFFKRHAPDIKPELTALPPEELAFDHGFILDESLALITDHEILQPRAGAKRRTRRLPIEFAVGDFVVHLFHGIAKFAGTKWMNVNGVDREYLELHYKDKDRLFVPVESADRVDRYIGAPHPIIHSLSGNEWLTAVKKATKYAKDIAYDLLRLHAKRETIVVPALPTNGEWEQQLAESFPYTETEDQLQAIDDIERDLQRTRPMDRLVCGDVGFGKTEIAMRAAFKCAIHGMQVAVLSPTTILTQQHFDTFRERLKPFPLRLAMLSRWQNPRQQAEVMKELAAGKIDIVIGTHRLLSSDVHFRKLGLMIVDEEQRFGVKDKERLKALRSDAHVLSLSATPIPRTLHMSLSGLKELSLLTTPPPERKPIQTVVERYRSDHIRSAVMKELKRKGQVYYLHGRVATIQREAKKFSTLVPEARVGIAHGQLPEEELAAVIKKFDEGAIDVLICSTIIENGLDLKNVNTLIIPDITLFGLAQLYQIRGRIGRSDRQAYAYLFYPSQKCSEELRSRVDALLETTELGSGYRLALRDMEIRGTGNLLGREQHGHIHAIGLTLYAQLLGQAVEELKNGGEPMTIRDISLDLPLPAFIPPAYTKDEMHRMRLYQTITHAQSLDDLRECEERLAEQKPLPIEMKNFFRLMETKILCQGTPVTAIDTVRADGRAHHFLIHCLTIPESIAETAGVEVHKNTIRLPLPYEEESTNSANKVPAWHPLLHGLLIKLRPPSSTSQERPQKA